MNKIYDDLQWASLPQVYLKEGQSSINRWYPLPQKTTEKKKKIIFGIIELHKLRRSDKKDEVKGLLMQWRKEEEGQSEEDYF